MAFIVIYVFYIALQGMVIIFDSSMREHWANNAKMFHYMHACI
jgi:hypothetical protein